MKQNSICVLAFYSDAAAAENSHRELRSAGFTDVRVIGPDGQRQGSRRKCQQFSDLRLENETLLVLDATEKNIDTVSSTLNQSGEAAVFLLRGFQRVWPAPLPVPEPLTGDRLRTFIADLARDHGPAAPPEDGHYLFKRLRRAEETIDEARTGLMMAVRLGHPVTTSAEWLLDNYYMVRTNSSDVARDLPRRYTKVLPVLPKRQGRMRVEELARELVVHTGYSLSRHAIEDALREYQTVHPLRIAELWAFPLLVRFALIEDLGQLLSRVNQSQHLRDCAYFWANRLSAGARFGEEVFDNMLRRMEQESYALRPRFLTALSEQLQSEESALLPVTQWLQERLQTKFTDLLSDDHRQETVERTSIANTFRSLRALQQIDFTEVFEAVSLVHADLARDPAGTYSVSDFATRDRCRRGVEEIARWSRSDELDVARAAIGMASRGGEGLQRETEYYLLDDGRAEFESVLHARPPVRLRLTRFLRKHGPSMYTGAVGTLTFLLVAAAVLIAWYNGMRSWWGFLGTLAMLSLLPLSELALQAVNWLVTSLLPPDKLPKMNFKHGIPREHAALVVIPMMLSSEEVTQSELEKLEVRYLANRYSNLWFGLFADYTDAKQAVAAGDEDLLRIAREGIERLNERYPGVFVLFHRPRSWSESEQSWIGRERKRGKLEELNAFLCGAGAQDILVTGSLPMPIRWVITLDADTQLPAGNTVRMVETSAHPLNRVEIDPELRVRKRGYTIIQPRVSIMLPSATATRFTRIFSDANGTDPYCSAVSDAQQDLLAEAIFHGKAIYDVRAFHLMMAQRFPPETLLSHDLIEGAHVGVALASDIELFENLPSDYASYCQRQHRWIRGDWQIAEWAWARVPAADGSGTPNPLTFINRWRIFDNLRRSLVPAASVLLLLAGGAFSHGAGVWSLVVSLAVVIPAIVPLVDRAVRKVTGARLGWRGALDELVRAVILIALLPHQMWVSVDAIVRALYRRYVSRRKVLEWQTAEAAGAQSEAHAGITQKQLRWIAGFSAVLLVGTALLSGGFHPLQPFLVLWTIAPPLVDWLGLPVRRRERRYLASQSDTVFLRGLARHTWRFFDQLMTPESNWLPPDNTQLSLRVEVAHRTSPTNIGLGLASMLGAWDLGYLTADGFAARCERTLATAARLEQYEGHLLNWYDTRTLQPLTPRYVSTVDSGNLLASLWVLALGCEDVINDPVLGAACVNGLADTLGIVTRECASDSSAGMPLAEMRRLLRGNPQGHELLVRLRLAAIPMRHLADTREWQESPTEERGYWVSCLNRELAAWTNIVGRYLSWMETLMQPPDGFIRILGEGAVKLRGRATEAAPSLSELAARSIEPVNALLGMRRNPGLPQRITEWLDQIAREYEQASAEAGRTVESLRRSAAFADSLASNMNMRFLYDPTVRQFGIGYTVGSALEFNSHYDLLASECRLASLVAIAKGDVPVEHWFALGRPRATSGGGDVLLSWTGGLFEYLMPVLFTRTFANSLLDDACHHALKTQIAYGRDRGLPWGISESAYSALDSGQTYQYRAFGVPALGLKPGLEDDLVVAPYAAMLSLLMDPGAAVGNLKKLAAAGLSGPMGLYEAIDFTRENSPHGEFGVVIYAYMAHHHGMSLLSLTNAICSGAMQRRFHADLRVRAVESLLFERIPLSPPSLTEDRTSPMMVMPPYEEEPDHRLWNQESAVPRIQLQGNGNYSVMVTNSGGGWSRYAKFDITRWRADTTRDPWGAFIYLRDLRSGSVWSTAYHPVGGDEGTLAARFAPDRAEFERRAYGIDALTAVTVAPEDDVELRRVTITNRTLRSRQIELTSYVELAMAQHGADRAHPAFAKMFVETECLDGRYLIAHRRKRSPDEPGLWTAHFIASDRGSVEYETERREFLGRGNTPANPAKLTAPLTGSIGVVLDPIFSVRCRVSLDTRGRREVTFVTAAAPTREALLAVIQRYSSQELVNRTFEMAWTRSQLEFRYLGIGQAQAQRFQELAGHLVYPDSRLRPTEERLARNRLGQERLWAYGISGDLPIVTVMAGDLRAVPLVREVLLAHTYWRLRGFEADLVILNQEGAAYDRPVKQNLERLIQAHSQHTGIDRPGGVFLRDWHTIPEEDGNLILAAASVVLYGGRGTLQQQLAPPPEVAPPAPFAPAIPMPGDVSSPLPFMELPYFNGLGGFTQDGREYAIYMGPGSATPAPWVNVMANPRFGAMVSESGLGMTWFGNSQANRLTPWHNDPVSDPQSEVIYLRDEESGAYWTPAALPIRGPEAYRARHGQGYTVFEHNSHGIAQELTVFVPAGENADPVKLYLLRLRNESQRTRRLTATFYAEWVLKTEREEQQLHVQTEWDEETGAVFARNVWNTPYARAIAFAGSVPPASSHTGDRSEFLGRNGSPARPEAMRRERLDDRTGAGLDPAAGLQVEIALEPGRESTVVFLLGEAREADEARAVLGRYRTPQDAAAALDRTRRQWDDWLGTLQVKTPLLSVDFLLNRWLLYQSMSCRFWGRTAMYQSGGAFGFRDQLQDAMALIYAAPQVARAHILLSASRQFPEGDVQHWWHPDTGAGVRTRCSDDLVWLAYVTARYVEATADRAILGEEAAFLDGALLANDEHEKYFVPGHSTQAAPLWDHCLRALRHAWQLGDHGLPLFGNGDWNDGMNLVGAGGKGESVWLAWFLCATYEMFAPMLEEFDPDAAADLRAKADILRETLERTAWDGDWYLRGYFDNGQPLGSHANTEARIDSIAQSWAVIAGAADEDHAKKAVESAREMLVRETERLVLLFTPAFDRSEPSPGYIRGYPPGVRENGGQYTHGSLWLAMASARLGDGEQAVRLLQLMNPVESARTPEMVARYHGEPYAVAADVSSAAGKEGRAGWTWYTGSAGWMYRIWVEEVLGFRLEGNRLTVRPVIPAEWPGFRLTYRYRTATYEIEVKRAPGGNGEAEVELADDGSRHSVVVTLAEAVQETPPESLEDTLQRTT